MKISLEFENAEKFFKELPKFAALIGFSGEFADFSHVKKSDLVSLLEKPDLPEIVSNKDGVRTIKGTPDQISKVSTAGDVSAAVKKADAAAKRNEPKDELAEAMNPPEEAPEEATEAAEQAPTAETDKSKAKEEKPAEKAQMAPEKKLSAADLKLFAAGRARAGHRAQLKDLLAQYGEKSVTDLTQHQPDKMQEFYNRLKEVTDAE